VNNNLGEFVAIMSTFLIGGVVVIRLTFAMARRLEGKPSTPAIPPDLSARLERIEQAVDSVAIEVERISEGQRFTTKLLNDRSQARAPESAR
jgi:hypothetical protein